MKIRRDKRIWYVGLGVFAMMFVFSFLVQKYNDREADAANMAAFDPGYIISDYQMGNYNSMSEAQIQSFLKSKNSCNDTRTYLTGNNIGRLSETTPYSWHVSGGHYVCMADENFNGESAAHIIWQAAQDYRINPQVLIVLLEKEQGLVTDTLPNSVQYRSATGYGCPDTAACSSKYYGFKNQVRNAAAMFRSVLDGGWTNYPVGNNYVRYSPNAACGGTTVNIKNRATSALYRYTPYQPNAAALSSSYGGGDGCSAYGNRNFYSYFEDWFGGVKSTQGSTKVPDGTYYIQVASNKSMVIDVEGGESANYTNIQLYTANNSAAQQWKVTYNSATDDYNIINAASGKALDLNGADTSDGTNVQLYTANGTCAQRWKIVRTSGNAVKILSACSVSKALGIHSGIIKNEGNINLWYDNGTSTQRWKLAPVDVVKDGLYTIRSAVNDGKVIDISGGARKAKNGTNIQLWSNNNTPAQRWYVERGSDGYYTVVNKQNGKVLDVSAAGDKDGVNIQAWSSNGSCAQKWQILKTGDAYTFISACSYKVIDLSGASTSNGSNIQIYQANNTKAQKWTLSPIELVEDGEYKIATELMGSKVLDLAGNNKANGANIQIYEDNETAAQQWTVTYDKKSDFYTIKNAGVNKVLDVASAGTTRGTNVQTWSSNGSCAQKWTIAKVGEGYKIYSGCSDLSLDVSGAGTKNGTNIWLYDSNGTKAQKWQLVRE